LIPSAFHHPRTVGPELQAEIPKIVTIDPPVLHTAKIVNIEQAVLHKAVVVEPPVLQSQIVKPVPKSGPEQEQPLTDAQQFEEQLKAAKENLKPKPKPGPDQEKPLTDAQKLQAMKDGLKKTDRGAEVYGYEKPKSGPDQEKPLTDAQKKLQAMKDGLKKTDRGAEVYGYEKPKSGPEQEKPLTDAQKLQAMKDGLKKTDRGAEVYGYEKPKSGPELTEVTPTIGIIAQEIVKEEVPKHKMDSIIEPVTVTSSVTLEKQPINHFSGLIVKPEVIEKAKALKNVILGTSPAKPEVDKDKEALNMLKDKTPEQALKAISNAIDDGDDKLVKAMMKVISPPDGKPIEGVPAVGRMALAKVYTDRMESTKGMDRDQDRSKVQRAAGAIADKAGIADHESRVTKPKTSQHER
jgi:hypothetical protein